MIELSTTATFDRLFKKLSSVIQRKAVTKTDLFKSNPFHPSLHTEKLHPKHHEVWCCYIMRCGNQGQRIFRDDQDHQRGSVLKNTGSGVHRRQFYRTPH